MPAWGSGAAVLIHASTSTPLLLPPGPTIGDVLGKKPHGRAAATQVTLLAATGTLIKKTVQTVTSNSFSALHEQKQGNRE